ncbi:MAG: helix-turn-helix domain-containing protein [Thermomicrobiales bacterium]
MIMQRRFRERVLERIQVMDITKAELARRMEVVGPYVHQYLSGRNCPGFDVVERFARALEIDPSRLVSPESLLDEAATTSRRRTAKAC